MGNCKDNVKLVKDFLDGDGWRYKTYSQGNATTFLGEIGDFKGVYSSFRFMVFVGEEEVQNCAMFPASAKDKMPEMAEFITRANYGLKFGRFEMDYRDGEVRFQLSFPISAARVDNKILPTLMIAPPRMLDQYSKGFTEVLMGLKTPADAIKDCEGDGQ